MIVDKACWERGCACHDDRVGGEGVEVVKAESTRVGHLHIQRYPERGIWLIHDNGEAMQTDEDKFYQHLMDYWNKEF